jgi:hypothetical protein
VKFVHSLVRTTNGSKTGWCAPIELGESSPHYISFVIPVVDGQISDRYVCEVAATSRQGRTIEVHEMIRMGADSFLLRVAEMDLGFTVRPVSRKERYLPYIGQLEHDDFTFRFLEIEPEDLAMLDQLFEDKNLVVVGCDPAAHYANHDSMLKQTHAL